MDNYSRYDFMEPGVVSDEVLRSNYPDPLSLNYLDLQLNNIPQKDIMNDSKISLFWNEAKLEYGIPGYDDVVLSLNGISHKNFLKPGDVVYWPSKSDIEESFKK